MKQITILSPHKNDLFADITQYLAEAGIDIDSITGDNYGEQAVVTITVRNYDAALKTIEKRSDLQVMSEDALLVRIEDEVGALGKLSRRFADAGIEIRSIRFVERHSPPEKDYDGKTYSEKNYCGSNRGYALVAISTERTKEALELVKDIFVS